MKTKTFCKLPHRKPIILVKFFRLEQNELDSKEFFKYLLINIRVTGNKDHG